jgi:hypothetical protein
MTVEEYNMKLKAFVQGLEKFNRPFEVAVQSTTQLIGNRIFSKGEKSDGSNIGQYDTKSPLYVNPDKVPSAKGLRPTKGKTGEHKFKNGKEHKTTYVNNYKELRNRIGRRIDKVNLILSGDLQSDWRNANTLSQKATAIKISTNEFVISLRRDINQKKMEGFNNKYGTISNTSKKERDNLYKVAQKELMNDLSKLGLV